MYKDILENLNIILDSYKDLDINIDKLKNIVDIQNTDGNWNFDDYMMGLANGLILSYAIMTNQEPNFKSKPKNGFLCNK